MDEERGQASVEWTAAVLVVAFVLTVAVASAGALAATAAPGFARAIRCAVALGCHGEDARLGSAYGDDAAALVRAYAPNLSYERGTNTLPIDFRRCRRHRCADAPNVPGLDVWRATHGGAPATVFTHVVDLRPAGPVYVQYWFYYPDSTYSGPARVLSKIPIISIVAKPISGFHYDDWEGYQVRIDPDGKVYARASAHHGYSGHNKWPDLDEAPDIPYYTRHGAWTPATGWTHVSRGSHAGFIVNGPGDERRTVADGIHLVPIETLPPAVRAQAFAIVPPWKKPVYIDPAGTGT
jgi:hypothetical protein